MPPRAALLASGDDVLRRVVEETPLPTLEPTGEVFHDLMSCLVEQQIHTRSTKGTFASALHRAGLTRLTPEAGGVFIERGLEGIKLSHRKREAIAGAADFFATDRTDWRAAPEAEVRKRLGALRGVGPWTVDMVRLYTLGHADVFPVDDYHLKKAMGALYGLASGAKTASGEARVSGASLKKQMRETAEAWRPHRSLAVRYLLAWKDWQLEKAR